MITAKEARAEARKFEEQGFSKTMEEIEDSIRRALVWGDCCTKGYIKDFFKDRVMTALNAKGFRSRILGPCDAEGDVVILIDWRNPT